MFCAEELQKVHKSDDIYKIEKILAEKKENGKVKVLVKWPGYDKKFNSWVPKSELRKLEITPFANNDSISSKYYMNDGV